VLAFTDGETVLLMAPARDYKPVFDGDQGPNTGSMGGYSPPVFLGDRDVTEVLERILKPAVRALAAEGRPYRGVLYAGLMLTPEGPRVLEFNARFGDPETQVILPRLKSDLLDVLEAVVNGRLHDVRLEWSADPCVGVVMASEGYPGKYEVGKRVQGLGDIDADVSVFHAGTKVQDGALVTDGGRVLTVAASGRTAAEARQRVYANVERICFDHCHYRKDIAAEAVA